MEGKDQIGQQDCNGAVCLEWLNDGSASWVYQEAILLAGCLRYRLVT